MKNPLMTIITPVYNGEKFIESCIQAVIAQNCPGIEHLIIDGASQDGTVDIISLYARHYPHIRCLSQKDTGQSVAMNRGIFMARGKVIGILNYDDFYEPGVLRRAVDIFETLPNPSFLVGNCNVLDDNGNVVYLNKPSRLSLTNVLIGGERNQFPFNPSAYFYHKSLHDKIGLYDVFDHYSMDLDFILRALKEAHIKYVDETWGNFRYIKGTKTYRCRESQQLEPNKKRVMDLYLKQLPLPQQWWINSNRFLFIENKPGYYAGRVKDCFKDPKELMRVVAKKLKKSVKDGKSEPLMAPQDSHEEAGVFSHRFE